MSEGLFTVLGGIGLFLFGMKVMADALREVAGVGLRRILARFTRTPLAGVATGAVATAVVQSSTAVTVMTIGFVGAGLMTFPQAIGVMYGANIGTTLTGWIVTFVGLKLQLGTFALPVLFVASLCALLGRGRIARIGRLLAGLSMVFIGLDMMQAGFAGNDGLITPERLPGDTFAGRFLLIGIGFVVTVVVQSSTASVAMTLVLLGSGSISFAQGAAMVIGMNVGTTLTALLASIGGSTAMRQTAVANVLFNVGTAMLAFPLLDMISPLLHGTALGRDDQTALVLFHTGFNVVGTLVFLPLTGWFCAFVARIVPERRAGPVTTLDAALLADPEAALDAAQAATGAVAQAVFGALGTALAPEPDLRALAALPGLAEPAMADIEGFLAKVHIPEDKAHSLARYSALLHQVDHLSRLIERSAHRAPMAMLPRDAALRRAALAVGAAMRRSASGMPPAVAAARYARLAETVDHRAVRHRRSTLLRERVGMVSVQELFQRTDAMRWLQRVVGHAERISHYGAEAEAGPAPAPASVPAPAARRG